MPLAIRLKLALKESGLKQADLARACGVKPASVSGWFSGKAKFLRGENLLLAARALGVDQDWLATGKGSMHRQTLLLDTNHLLEAFDHQDSQSRLTERQQEWLALLEGLGSEDIEEFKALIKRRQERNIRLIDELENTLHPKTAERSSGGVSGSAAPGRRLSQTSSSS